MSRFRNVGGWLCAAALLAVGYESARAWPAAIFGAAAFLYCARHCRERRDAFFGGWLAGALYFGAVTRWLFAVWPAEWLGLERDPIALPLIFAAWTFLAFLMGSAFGALGFAVSVISRRVSRGAAFSLVFLPSAWTIAEYIRAWMFSFAAWGEGAFVGPHWTFGHMGYALAGTPLFRLSPFVGLYGLSWILVFAGAVFVFGTEAVRRKERFATASVLFGAAALAILFGISRLYPATSGSAEPLTAVSFQSDTRLGPIAYRNAVRQSIGEFFLAYPDVVPDVVVLPEDARLFSISEDEERELLAKFFRDPEKDGLVVTSATVGENGRRAKYAYFVAKDGAILGRQPKTFLIPGGEFMPSAFKPVFRIFGRKDFLETFRGLRQIAPGSLETPYVESGGVKFAAGICSGVLSPHMYRRLSAEGAEVLLNPTSFSVFHGSTELLKETERMARFRAAENARPLIQSANAGYSLIIDARGNVVSRAPSLGSYIISGSITPGRAETPVQRFGDWPVGVSAFIFAIYFLARFLRFRYLRNST